MSNPALAPDVQVRLDRILIGLKPYQSEIDKILIGLKPPDKSVLTAKALKLLNSAGSLNEPKIKQELLNATGHSGGVSHSSATSQVSSIIAVLIGLLLPAVQKAIQSATSKPSAGAAGQHQSITDGTSNTIFLQENLRRLEELERILPRLNAPQR